MKAYEIIGAAVQERGITCSELARRIGVSAEIMRRCLSGERKIGADEFVALCRELDLSIGDFQKVA